MCTKYYLIACSSIFMQLAKQELTARGAWCKQCLPGRCKPDMLRPGIVGMRGSMVLQTTAMHYMIAPCRFAADRKRYCCCTEVMPRQLSVRAYSCIPSLSCPLCSRMSSLSYDCTPRPPPNISLPTARGTAAVLRWCRAATADCWCLFPVSPPSFVLSSMLTDGQSQLV